MALVKFIGFVLSAVLFIIHHQVAGLFFRDENKKLKYYLKSIRLTCLWGLKILNIKVEMPKFVSSQKGQLLISNHLSYVDILVLFAHYPSLFVTSTEMRDVFFLGRLTKLAGCFFVERRKERRSAFSTAEELNDMKSKLVDGFNVFLFPEGTSSNGETVLPFKATFFQTSFDLTTPIRPMVLTYDRVDLISWYGDMTFPGHLYKLCQHRGFTVRISNLEEIFPTNFKDKFEMANYSHQSIKEIYEAG